MKVLWIFFYLFIYLFFIFFLGGGGGLGLFFPNGFLHLDSFNSINIIYKILKSIFFYIYTSIYSCVVVVFVVVFLYHWILISHIMQISAGRPFSCGMAQISSLYLINDWVEIVT